jgi:hypothetical protein
MTGRDPHVGSRQHLRAARRWGSIGDHWYGLGLLAALIFAAVFKWQILASRYHQPFFALLGPWVVVIAASLLRPQGMSMLSGLLLIASIPWLLGIRTRPLLPLWDQPKVGRLLTESRQRLMFASGDCLEVPCTEMTALIRQEACGQVGGRDAGQRWRRVPHVGAA